MKYSILVRTHSEEIVYIVDTRDGSIHVYDARGVQIVEAVTASGCKVTLNSVTTAIVQSGYTILNVDAMDSDMYLFIPRTILITSPSLN